jgi:hypothetical protein
MLIQITLDGKRLFEWEGDADAVARIDLLKERPLSDFASLQTADEVLAVVKAELGEETAALLLAALNKRGEL